MIQRIGSHVVSHGDLTHPNVIENLLEGKKVNFMYSDPPWGEGNLKYWQTINKKMTGAEPNETNLDSFLHKIFSIAKNNVTEVIWIEYGIRWRDRIYNLSKEYGLVHNGIANLKYRSGSRFLPLDLHLLSHQPLQIPESYFENLENTYAMETLRKAINPFAVAGKSILDPACGMGYTAQAAIENGLIFYGNELNSKRLEKTIKRLS